MITMFEQVTESPTHIHLPIARQAVCKVIDDLGINKIFENKIFYTGDYIHSSKSSNDDQSPLLHGDRMNCNIEVSHSIMSQKDEVAKSKDVRGPRYSITKNQVNRPMFLDPSIDMSLTCIEKPLYITLTNSMQFNDRSEAYSVYDRFTNTYQFGDYITVQDFIFTIPIPIPIFLAMNDISVMKGNQPSQLMSYLRLYSDKSLSLDINRHDSNKMELVSRHSTSYVNIQMELNSDKPTAVEDEQSTKVYEIEFVMHIQCQRPDHMMLKYPIVVNNQFIPGNLITDDDSEADNTDFIYVHKNCVSANFHNSTEIRPTSCVTLPWYDKWIPPAEPLINSKYIPFFQAVVLLDDIDDPNGSTVIDLSGDLDGLLLDPEILDILRIQGSYSLLLTDYINITVYSNNNIVDTELLEFDGELLTIHNRNIARTYRLVISELYDPLILYTDLRRVHFIKEFTVTGDKVRKLILYPDNTIKVYTPEMLDGSFIIDETMIDSSNGDVYDVTDGIVSLETKERYTIKHVIGTQKGLCYKDGNPVRDITGKFITLHLNPTPRKQVPDRNGRLVDAQRKGVKYGPFNQARITQYDIVTEQQ